MERDKRGKAVKLSPRLGDGIVDIFSIRWIGRIYDDTTQIDGRQGERCHETI